MKKKGVLWLSILFLILFSVSISVSALGECDLDKNIFHPGEDGTFTCSCTLGNEKNQPGFIVFVNSSDDVLQSTSISSGNCIGGIFGDSYVFPLDSTDYIGNATFSLNADGTGTPVNWDDVLDVTVDDFNVSNASSTDCLIEEIILGQNIIVGDVGSVKFKVKDGVTNEGLVHATCIADIYDFDGAPFIFIPNDPAHLGFKFTTSEGEVGFTHEFTELFWNTSTIYQFEFHCFSLPGDGTNDGLHTAYLDVSGNNTGLRSCTAQALFKTADNDHRIKEYSSILLPIILTSMFLILLFVGLFLINQFKFFKWANLIFAFFEMFIMLGMVYGDYIGNDLTGILKLNFIIFGTIGFMVLLASLIFKSINIMSMGAAPDQEMTNFNDPKFMDDKFIGEKL